MSTVIVPNHIANAANDACNTQSKYCQINLRLDMIRHTNALAIGG